MTSYYKHLRQGLTQARDQLLKEGQLFHPHNWQARTAQVGMVEILNFSFAAQMPSTVEALVKDLEPDLPWAELHFAERVSGYPLNPAPSYMVWPYYKHDELWKVQGDKFSHTYPERFWVPHLEGVRYTYGNLGDLLDLLERDPTTRQAFLPMWFPEDTGAAHGERVPCTIGYHFQLRDNKLHMYYPMRSCDYRRHMKNDLYMATRMTQWLIEMLSERNPLWKDVTPGTLQFNCYNLHIFEGEERVI